MGEYEEAFDIVRHAVTLPVDGATQSHRVWLAFELALAERYAESRDWLSRAGDLTAAPYLGAVRAILEAPLAMERARGPIDLDAFRAARSKLTEARARCTQPALLRAHQRASRRVADAAGLVGFAWLHRATLAKLAVAAVVLCAVGLGATISTHGDTVNLTPLIFPTLWIAQIALRRKYS